METKSFAIKRPPFPEHFRREKGKELVYYVSSLQQVANTGTITYTVYKIERDHAEALRARDLPSRLEDMAKRTGSRCLRTPQDFQDMSDIMWRYVRGHSTLINYFEQGEQPEGKPAGHITTCGKLYELGAIIELDKVALDLE